MTTVKPTKRGIRVECAVCGQTKCPRGRSAPLGPCYCDRDCSGYTQEPHVGSLWPGETDAEFGFPCGDVGTEPYVMRVAELDLELDSDGYPTEESLRQIAQCKAWTRKECAALLSHVRSIWQYADSGYWNPQGDDEYRISTAGWSGNESILAALQDNVMFWMRCWERSQRGGHFIFKLPKESL